MSGHNPINANFVRKMANRVHGIRICQQQQKNQISSSTLFERQMRRWFHEYSTINIFLQTISIWLYNIKYLLQCTRETERLGIDSDHCLVSLFVGLHYWYTHIISLALSSFKYRRLIPKKVVNNIDKHRVLIIIRPLSPIKMQTALKILNQADHSAKSLFC